MDAHVIGESFERCFVSSSVDADNTVPANLVDVVQRLALHTGAIASAITPRGASPSADATGGYVSSLTEAVMGLTAGMCRIADAIESLAAAVSEK